MAEAWDRTAGSGVDEEDDRVACFRDLCSAHRVPSGPHPVFLHPVFLHPVFLHPVFLHTAVISQDSTDGRAAFADEFVALGRRRPPHRPSTEPGRFVADRAVARRFTAAANERRVRATVDAHGRWIAWRPDTGLQRR